MCFGEVFEGPLFAHQYPTPEQLADEGDSRFAGAMERYPSIQCQHMAVRLIPTLAAEIRRLSAMLKEK